MSMNDADKDQKLAFVAIDGMGFGMDSFAPYGGATTSGEGGGIMEVRGHLGAIHAVDTASTVSQYRQLIRTVEAPAGGQESDTPQGHLLQYRVQIPEPNHPLFRRAETIVNAQVGALEVVWLQQVFMDIINYSLDSILSTLLHDVAAAVEGAVKEANASRVALSIGVKAPDVVVPSSPTASEGLYVASGDVSISNCFEKAPLPTGRVPPLALLPLAKRRRALRSLKDGSTWKSPEYIITDRMVVELSGVSVCAVHSQLHEPSTRGGAAVSASAGGSGTSESKRDGDEESKQADTSPDMLAASRVFSASDQLRVLVRRGADGTPLLVGTQSEAESQPASSQPHIEEQAGRDQEFVSMEVQVGVPDLVGTMRRSDYALLLRVLDGNIAGAPQQQAEDQTDGDEMRSPAGPGIPDASPAPLATPARPGRQSSAGSESGRRDRASSQVSGVSSARAHRSIKQSVERARAQHSLMRNALRQQNEAQQRATMTSEDRSW